MATTYEKIATTTLGTAGATITFSSISSAYTDLRLVLVSVGSLAGTSNVFVQFNGDTGSNYSRTILNGSGASAASFRSSSQASINIGQGGLDDTQPTFCAIDLFSYTGSTYKTILFAWNQDLNGSGNVMRGVGLWQSTSAVNEVKLFVNGMNFNTGTTATLYGILKA